MSKNFKSQKDPEAEAITAITVALDNIPEGRKLAVLKYVYERFAGSGDSPVSDSIAGGQRAPSLGKNDIKTFLKGKNPQTPYQQVAVLAYYLKENRNITEVNKKIIEEANLEALGRTIDDVTGVLNDAKNKYHFFGSSAGGKKFLLVHGEDIVNALPDQKIVAELIRSSNKRRGRKNKKKKK
jgi:hypothetical protein